MYWPEDTYIVSNVAREAKRVAHPWSNSIRYLIDLFKGQELNINRYGNSIYTLVSKYAHLHWVDLTQDVQYSQHIYH